MPESRAPWMRVECTECHFSRVVTREDEVIPAQVIVEHGRETGHTLNAVPLDE